MAKRKVLISEDELENTPVAIERVPVDRINSLEQKENSLAASGVTRKKYMMVIADALVAEKYEEYKDEIDGIYKKRLVPDMSRRMWAAEQSAKLLGDYVEMKNVTVGHFTFMDLVKLTEQNKSPSRIKDV